MCLTQAFGRLENANMPAIVMKTANIIVVTVDQRFESFIVISTSQVMRINQSNIFHSVMPKN